MLLRDTFKISFESLMRNKSRAILTMLGIIIGVISVILMLSIGNAAEDYILSQVASFGSDMVFVRNGPGNGTQGAGPPTSAVKQVLTFNDYKKLEQQTWISSITAVYDSNLLVEHQGTNKRVNIFGMTERGLSIFDAEVDKGQFFTSDDVSAHGRVAVLGSSLAADLFGEENPLDKQIKINKQNYRIIGVLKPAGTKMFNNLDQQIYVPVTTLMQQENQTHILFIALKVGNVSIAEAKDRLRAILRDAHNIDNPHDDLSKDPFFVASQEDVANIAGVIGGILQILLVSIAAISLIVGGVGIMNIMFVTVTERTREIGLRKAIGAKKNDILMQFLFEAVLLCVISGLIGVILGVSMSWLGITALHTFQSPNWTFAMPYTAIALGLGVSTAIGLIFGYIPAKRAADLSPIQALQYE